MEPRNQFRDVVSRNKILFVSRKSIMRLVRRRGQERAALNYVYRKLFKPGRKIKKEINREEKTVLTEIHMLIQYCICL